MDNYHQQVPIGIPGELYIGGVGLALAGQFVFFAGIKFTGSRVHGDSHIDPRLVTGSLYRLDGDLSLHKMDDNYFIPNGPTFSLDGKTLYHTDTAKRTIYAFDLSEDGAIANKRVFVKLETEEEGNPDGMTVDSENCIWLSHFAGSRITRYSPEGQVLQDIPMPVPNITSCTFAGPDLDTLYITTARHLLSEEEIQKYPAQERQVQQPVFYPEPAYE